jgi:hypothetical protein
MININSVEELEYLLKNNYNIDTSKYNIGTSKTLSQLYKEIKDGETTLYSKDNKLFRKVEVLSIVFIREDNKILIEKSQHFHRTLNRQDYSRSRMLPLAEKIKTGEDIEKAVKRAILEELQLTDDISINKIVTRTEIFKSNSYPELLTKYILYSVLINNIPKSLLRDEFDITEYHADESHRVTATWSWIDIETLRKYEKCNNCLISLGI